MMEIWTRCDNSLITITSLDLAASDNFSYSHIRRGGGGGSIAWGHHHNIICEDRILIQCAEHKISDENLTACFLIIKSAQVSGLSVKITGDGRENSRF